MYLCLDNDKPGKDATKRIVNELLENEKYSHISICIAPPPVEVGKDFNDVLMFMRDKIKERLKDKRLEVESNNEAHAQKSDVGKKSKGVAL